MQRVRFERSQARRRAHWIDGRGARGAPVMVGTHGCTTRQLARWLAWAGALGALGAWCGARELDPAACARRFDVQRDKIIRTEESRDMGARYLSELDVGARGECLRLCCETDGCDVFVYEEKGPGSCYLFACGPPEDFRCKFTAHGNFTSGVLALSRRLAELQDAERAPPPPASAPASTPLPRASTALPTTSTSTTTSTPPPAPDLLLTHVGRCSRYQFECVVGGECIAVYNACDGVPQCADGSDEAAELGCPPPALPAAAAPRSPPPPRPAPPDRWPHRLTQAQPQQRYTEPDTSSHIFSHKGGLLQEAEAPAPPYQPFESPWPRRTAWPQHQSGESWGGGGQGAPPPPYARVEWSERAAWPVPPPPRRDPESLYGALTAGASAPPPPAPPAPPAAPSVPPHTPAPRHDTHPHQDKVSPASSAAAVAAAAAAAAVARVAAAEAAAEEGGLSASPPAALLLLVLGLLMTVALAGVAGCGAGVARRRLRRGKPLQHDADYLVNGMYL